MKAPDKHKPPLVQRLAVVFLFVALWSGFFALPNKASAITFTCTDGSSIEAAGPISPEEVTKRCNEAAAAKTAAEDSKDKNCYDSGLSLGWIICPILDLIDKGLNQFKEHIKSVLEIKGEELGLEPSNDSSGTKVAWQNFSRLSTVLIVIGTLIMIISTALSIGPFDNYTIKKMLPKLLMSIIFIQLSWVGLTFLIRVSNAFGAGVEGLILNAFGIDLAGGGRRAVDLVSFGGVDGNFDGFLALAGLGGAALGLIAILPLALSALLGFLVGFVVLTFRKVIVIALLIVSPIAIATRAIPGMEGWFKRWWDLFTKALIMYPLIMLFLTIGAVFADIFLRAGSRSGASGSANKILAMISYFGPYFLIPLTFRFAGGLISSVGGMINDRNRGFIDARKKKSAEKVARNRSDTMRGGNTGGMSQMPGLRRLNRAVSTTGRHLGAGAGNNFGFSRRGVASMSSRMQAVMPEFEKREEVAALANDEDARLALTYENVGEAQAALLQQKMVDATSKFQKIDQDEAAGTISATQAASDRAELRARIENEARDGAARAKQVGYSQLSQVWAMKSLSAQGRGFKSANDARAAIVRVARGNRMLANDIKGQAEFGFKGAGKFDMASLGDSFSQGEVNTYWEGQGPLARRAVADGGLVHSIAGASPRMDSAVTPDLSARQIDENIIRGWDKGDIVSIAKGPEDNLNTSINTWVDEYERALGSGDMDRAMKAERALTELKLNKNWAVGTSARAIDRIDDSQAAATDPASIAARVARARNAMRNTTPVGPGVPETRAVRDPANPNNWIWVPTGRMEQSYLGAAERSARGYRAPSAGDET